VDHINETQTKDNLNVNGKYFKISKFNRAHILIGKIQYPNKHIHCIIDLFKIIRKKYNFIYYTFFLLLIEYLKILKKNQPKL
jgi:hypothetical protein